MKKHKSFSHYFNLGRFLPILHWGRRYHRSDFGCDLLAGIVTAVVLIPQGIAFGLRAGLNPETGLYASLWPPAIYAFFGTSRTLSVGPVSVASIMVASALAAPELIGHGSATVNALVLTAECGIIMLIFASLRMGDLVHFISHPVLAGFTGGAAVVIIATQLQGLLGLPRWHCAPTDLTGCGFDYLHALNPLTAVVGIGGIIALKIFAGPLARWLTRCGVRPVSVIALSRSGPLVMVIVCTLLVAMLDLHSEKGVAVVGAMPSGLPDPSLGLLIGAPFTNWIALAPSAFFIALIAYVESVAIAKVTAHIRRQTIDPNQELIALGLANYAAALFSGMPVAGGLGRTMVNFAAGARTQLAALVTVGLLLLAVAFLTPAVALVPKTALAAIILVSVWPLLGLKSLFTTWRYDRTDALCQAATFAGVILFGLEAGLGLGIAISLLGYMWHIGRPHITVVGRLPGTHHFRGISRHDVETWPEMILIRIDESLTFANAGFVEDFVNAQVRRHPDVLHIVLIGSAINYIDSTALEALERLTDTLKAAGMTLHLSEIKGKVLDRLGRTDLAERLSPGETFHHTAEAVAKLTGDRPGILGRATHRHPDPS